jgi:hypothetical protein
MESPQAYPQQTNQDRVDRMVERPSPTDPVPIAQPERPGVGAVHADPGALADAVATENGLELRPMSPDGKSRVGYSHREGNHVCALVIAKTLSGFIHGFADSLAFNHAGEFGMSGAPVIDYNNSRAFPVDSETLAPIAAPTKDCRWGKFIVLSSRGI